MKKLIFILLAISASLIGCTDEYMVPGAGEGSGTNYIKVKPESVTLISDGESKNVSVEANVNWTATAKADAGADEWCSVTPTSANGNKVISITATANPTTQIRTAKVTIKSEDGTITKTIKVTQQAAVEETKVLSVNPTAKSVAAAGDTFDATVTANVDYDYAITYTTGADWVEVTGSNNVYSVKVLENETTDAREAKVTFKQTDGTLQAVLTITQDGLPKKLTREDIAVNVYDLVWQDPDDMKNYGFQKCPVKVDPSNNDGLLIGIPMYFDQAGTMKIADLKAKWNYDEQSISFELEQLGYERAPIIIDQAGNTAEFDLFYSACSKSGNDYVRGNQIISAPWDAEKSGAQFLGDYSISIWAERLDNPSGSAWYTLGVPGSTFIKKSAAAKSSSIIPVTSIHDLLKK